jgi:methylenetetrahydrofolate reductase (NADPH)
MRVSEHLAKADGPLFSFEVVPPNRGHNVNEIIEVIHQLEGFRPSWIDVTSHAPYAIYRDRRDGSIERIVHKKRPGTLGICGVIQNRFRIDTVAHILCLGFTREETEDALIELNYLGVHNVLALRGDGPNFEKKNGPGKSSHSYAADLVSQIRDLQQGKYLSDLDDARPLDFCVGVAGYPEKHFEAPNLRIDIQNLKRKVEAGAEYIVTQMFFDNAVYFEFVRQCREAGIAVPIVPGLKVIRRRSQLGSIPKTFHCDMPEQFVEEILSTEPTRAEEVGIEHAVRQGRELLEKGAPGLHFYVLNDATAVRQVMSRLSFR